MNRRTIIIVLHLAFWILNGVRNYLTFRTELSYLLLDQFFVVVPFYVNYFILVPYFFKKTSFVKSWIWAVSALSCVIVSYAVCQYVVIAFSFPALFESTGGLELNQVLLNGLEISFLYIPASTAARLVLFWVENQEKSRALILKKKSVELQHYKTSLDFPFILNALDHAETYASSNFESVQNVILSLSKVLRYKLYENRDVVPLKDEIEAVQAYLGLVNDSNEGFKLSIVPMLENSGKSISHIVLLEIVRVWINIVIDELSGDVEIRLLQMDRTIEIQFPKTSGSDFFRSTIIERPFVLPFSLVISEDSGYVIITIKA